MDPDATYRLMIDESNDLDERAVAATDLLVWLATQAWTPVRVGPGNWHDPRQLADECKLHIFRALDRLAELEGS